MTASSKVDARKNRNVIVVYDYEKFKAYKDEHGVQTGSSEPAVRLPSGVHISSINVSVDKKRAASSHRFSFEDVLAMRDWFGGVTLVNELPDDWHSTDINDVNR